jgi:phosphoglycolate phosphatase-like HAD superfamily hydrolase/ADP-ribose pyrophosphatase YjhB (NUDIX family)
VIRNVIFDWSGTLVDDLPAVWRATNAVLTEVGLPPLSLDRFRAEFKLPFDAFCRDLAAAHSLAHLEARFHHHFRTQQHDVPALPHAREFLVFCRDRGLRTFVLSTILAEYFTSQAARTGFAEYIDYPYLEVRDKRTRIGELLATHDLRPQETVFIGDMQHDIDTARHGGVLACAVLTGYNRLDQLRASGPDLIVEHLGELQAILQRNNFELRPPGATTDAAHDLRPVATVGALIYNAQGQVLMVRTRKWSNLWGIPGGKIKPGEPAAAALRREIKEETNLDLGEVRFALVQDCIQSTEFYRPAHFVLLNYTARAMPDGVVRLNDEAEEYRWLGIEEALRLPLNQPTRTLIEAVRRPTERPDAPSPA